MSQQALVVARYLVREYITNPLFRRRKVLGALLVTVLTAAAVATAAALLAGGDGPEEEGGSPREVVRGFIRSTGLGKDSLISLASSSILLIAMALVAKGWRLSAQSEAEYELILPQPVGVGAYLAGRLLYQAIHAAGFAPLYLPMALIAMDLNGGDAKALVLPLSLALAMFVLSGLLPAACLAVNAALRARGLVRKARGLLIAYAAASIAHSAATGQPSPLLTAPFGGLVKLVVYPLTISETLLDVAYSLAEAVAASLALAAGLAWSARHLTPEDLAPAGAAAAKRLWRAKLRLETPGAAIRSYVLGQSVLNKAHLAKVSAAVALATPAAYAFKQLPPGLQLAATTSVPAFMLWAVLNLIVAKDVQAQWVYRVYLADPRALASNLLIKYTTYLLEAMLIASYVEAVASGDPLLLLPPVAAAPLALSSSFLMLATTLRLASRKKVVKQTPRGDVLDELASSLVLATTLLVFVAPYGLLRPTPPAAALTALATIPLHAALTRLLAKTIERQDLAA